MFHTEPLASDCKKVGRDRPGLYGSRSLCFVQLRHRASGRVVWFGSHHGPLPVNSGGEWGGRATGRNMLDFIKATTGGGAAGRGHPDATDDELVVLVGDFNAGRTSKTVQELQKGLDLLPADYGGHHWSIDHIFVNKNLLTLSPQTGNAYSIGSGGSDHPQMKADIFLP